MFGLPENVKFCKLCVISNQRPASVPEFKHTPDRAGAKYMHINDEGICDACLHGIEKEKINWATREEELLKLLDKYRKNNGEYDCLVPGSGGKDSCFQSHILKTKYGMNPLTCTWSPFLYTDYGLRNFNNWLAIGGHDNVSFRPNGEIMKLLTKLSIQNLFHPFQTFILGQKNLPPKIAKQYNIDLIFYGENEAEYGNPLADNSESLRDKSYFSLQNFDDVYMAGIPMKELKEKHGIRKGDLSSFLPMTASELESTNLQVHYLGYYLKWIPQEAYYYSVENLGFEARPFRSQGTYSKYHSIDDKIDDLHWYTTYIKFGIGRASYDASQEIRNNHLTREEAVALVNKYDGEFPDRYFNELMEYIGMDPDEFHQLADKFRPPHLWEKSQGANEWKLKKKLS
jgi:N-acetyl sugar amidotransferase